MTEFDTLKKDKGSANLVKVRGANQPPYLLFVLLFAAFGWDLIFVITPLVYEGVILDRPPMSIFGLDQWFVHVSFGISYEASFSAYGVFVPFLLTVFFVTLLIGFLVPFRTVRPIFRKLLAKHEVIYPELRVAAAMGLDLLLVLLFVWFGFDRILAYLTQYPSPLPNPLGTSSSFIAIYVVSGFLTGNSIAKSMFAFRVYLECRWHKLEVKTVVYKKLDAQGKLGRRRLFKWVLVPRAEAN